MITVKSLHELDAGRLTQWESATIRPFGRALSGNIIWRLVSRLAVSHGEVTALFRYISWWAINSVARVLPSHGKSHWFESSIAHQLRILLQK